MGEIQKYSLKDELLKKDEELKDDPALVGISGLTMPRYINSMRSVMFTAHTRQFTTLINPNFPYVFTNMENLVGKHSDSYYQVKHDTIVYKKIVKYEDIVDRPTEYTMFLYDKKKKKYSVVIRDWPHMVARWALSLPSGSMSERASSASGAYSTTSLSPQEPQPA